MRRFRERTLAARSMDFFGGLPLGVGLIEVALFLADEAKTALASLTALAILAALLGVGTLYFKQDLVNHWYRAAYRVGWVVSTLLGLLLIGVVVTWAISGAVPGQLPFVSEVLILSARVGFAVDAALIAGLAAAGWFARN